MKRDFKLSIELPEGWGDSTWRNDITPSMTSPNGRVYVMVDTEDHYFMLTEGLECCRFCAFDNETGDTVGDAETFEELLPKISHLF